MIRASTLAAMGVALLLLLAGYAAVRAGDDAPAPRPAGPAAQVAVVAQVSFAGQADIDRLAATYDVWHVDHQAGIATIWLRPSDAAHLRAQGRTVTVDRAATAAHDAATEAATRATADAGIPGFACYRTIDETYADMAQLAKEHPMLVRTVTLGESWDRTQDPETGYELRAMVLTNQAIPGPKPAFFLMAAIHAREYTTAETAMRFAEQLINGYGVDADATWLLDYTELHIVPQANPDGRKKAEQFATGLEWWRKNTNSDLCSFNSFSYGVDLNRNSSFKWGECDGFFCSSSDACSLTFRGTAAASEPETLALETYMRDLFPDARGELITDTAPADTPGVMISLHSYFPRVLFPWGWTALPAPNQPGLQTLARKFGYYTGYPACQSGSDGCIYKTDGTTDDFAYGELGVAAFTFELGTAFHESCTNFESSIVTPTLEALRFAAKAAVQPYIAPAGPEVISATLSVPGLAMPGDVVTITVTADDTRSYSGGFGVDAVQPIRAVRYSVDQPSWISGTVTYSMTASGVFSTPVEQAVAAIDTSGWTLGRHLLFVEAQDDAGTWGVPTAVRLIIGEHRYFPYVRR